MRTLGALLGSLLLLARPTAAGDATGAFAPYEDVLEVVAELTWHLRDDVYRFPPPKDPTGHDIYRLSLHRLENWDKRFPGRLRDVTSFARAEALERLGGYAAARDLYTKVAALPSPLAARAAEGVTRAGAFADAAAMAETGPDLDATLSALRAKLDAWAKLRTGYGGTVLEPVVQVEEERLERRTARLVVEHRRLLDNGADTAERSLRFLVEKHADSKLLPDHILRLADLYADLARDYVEEHERPLVFEEPAFVLRADRALDTYRKVAMWDGAPEKPEAQARFTAFDAYKTDVLARYRWRRIVILLGAALLAAPARADLLQDAAASDAAVEERVRSLLVQALRGDAAATEAEVRALEDVDDARAGAGYVRTGLSDDARYLAASLWLTRDGRRRALQHVLDGRPDPVVRRLAEHRIETDDAATAERLLEDDRHNRRATLVNGAVRPLGIFSGAAFLAALNPFIMAGSAVDSAVTTAVNLWHYNRLSTPEREALARYRRQLEREPGTRDAAEIVEEIRRLGAKRAAALCDETVQRGSDALDEEDLDRAAFYRHAAAALEGCAERAAKPSRAFERALAKHAAREDAGRWPVDDPPRAMSDGERQDHDAVVVAAALGDPEALLAASAAFRARHPKSRLLPGAELASALALDLANRRPEARDALAALAADDDGSAGRRARGILDSAAFGRLDAVRSAERRHTRETARFVLLGPPNGRHALYSAAQLGAEGVRAAESIGIFNVIGVATRAWQAWRRDPISNQEIIDRGEEFLAREPASEDVPEVHGRLADAYERAEQYPRALMHYRLSDDPDADHVAELESRVADQLLVDAQKRGNDPVLLGGIAEKFGATEAGEKARALLDEHRDARELVLDRDVLLEHPALMGPDALDLDPRLLDGERDNGELADGGVTLAPNELRLALRADRTSDDDRVETRALEPQPYARARAAAQEVLYTRLLTSEQDPKVGRFERLVPFFLTGTVDPGGGLYVYPGVKTRKYQSEDRRLYE